MTKPKGNEFRWKARNAVATGTILSHHMMSLLNTNPVWFCDNNGPYNLRVSSPSMPPCSGTVLQNQTSRLIVSVTCCVSSLSQNPVGFIMSPGCVMQMDPPCSNTKDSAIPSQKICSKHTREFSSDDFSEQKSTAKLYADPPTQ